VTKVPTLMSYSFLVETAQVAERETDQQMSGFATRYPNAIDTLLKLPHWFGVDPRPQHPVFHAWARNAYVTTCYTFAAMYHLYRAGSYLEASILQRNLSEVLVQFAYFTKYPEKAENHFVPEEVRVAATNGTPLTSMPRGKPGRWIDMFDDVSPGYYRDWYALASRFAHGALGSDIFRVAVGQTGAANVTHGLHYNQSDASYVNIQATALMYGYLRRFPEVFVQWDATAGDSLRQAALTSMDEILRDQWDTHQNARDWLRLVGKLTGWSEPAP
jgi:hypothetical protein